MSSGWNDAFGPQPMPDWLDRFRVDPAGAVDELLMGRAFLGAQNVGDPKDALIDWALLLQDYEDFSRTLDEALRQWVVEHWGRARTDPSGGTNRLAVAWCRLEDTVSTLETLDRTAETLRSFLDERYDYLGALAVGTSPDPLGRYLFAISRYQRSRELAATWWHTCDLVGQTPFYHGSYGVAGVRGMPAIATQSGGFRDDVASAVVKLGVALERLVQDRILAEWRASEEFISIARVTMRAYPFPALWKSTFHRDDLRHSKLVRKWAVRLVGPEPDRSPGANTGSRVREHSRWRFDPTWKWRVEGFLEHANRGDLRIPEIEPLLEEQRAYTEATGDALSLVISLARLGRAAATVDQNVALAWITEALRWDRTNSYAWQAYIRILRLAGRTAEALPAAWEAIERLPHVVHLWTELLSTLQAAGMVSDAEEIAREAIERFPGDKYFSHGLTKALVTAGKIDEALEVARHAVKEFEHDPHVWAAFGETLVSNNLLEEAKGVYELTISYFPQDPRWWIDLAGVLRDLKDVKQAEVVLRDAVQRFPDDIHSPNMLGTLLKHSSRLPEAREVFEGIVAKSGNAVARINLASVLRLLGQENLAEALQLIEGVLGESHDVEALLEKARILEMMGDLVGANETSLQAQSISLSEDAPGTGTLESETPFGEEWDWAPDGQHHRLDEKAPETDFGVPAKGPAVRRQQGMEFASPGSPPGTGAANKFDHGPEDVVPPSKTLRNQLPRAAVLALGSRARLLRRLARRAETEGRNQRAAALRQEAVGLLERVLASSPDNPRANAEHALLLIDSHQFLEAEQFIGKATSRLPGVLGLRYVLARSRRELARKERRLFRPEEYGHLTAPLRALEQINSTFRPLVRLGEGRASLALTDGAVAEAASVDAFGRLRQTLHTVSEEPRMATTPQLFHQEWARKVDSLVFRQEPTNEHVDDFVLAKVRESISSNELQLDTLEEEFSNWFMAQTF